MTFLKWADAGLPSGFEAISSCQDYSRKKLMSTPNPDKLTPGKVNLLPAQ
jgi:hypothetical protein